MLHFLILVVLILVSYCCVLFLIGALPLLVCGLLVFPWSFFMVPCFLSGIFSSFLILESSLVKSLIWLKSSTLSVSILHSLYFCFLFESLFFNKAAVYYYCAYSSEFKFSQASSSSVDWSPASSSSSSSAVSPSSLPLYKNFYTYLRTDLSSLIQSVRFLTTSLSPVLAFSFSYW